MPADSAAAAGPASTPPPPERQQESAAAAAASDGGSNSGAAGPPTGADYEADRKSYEGLPLGLLRPTVIPHGAAAAHAALTAGRTRLLCYFLHRHLEFRLPEVQSLAEAERSSGRGCARAVGGAGGDAPAVVWEQPHGDRPESPFWYGHFASEAAAAAVGAQSMLAKAVIEVWGEGETLEDLQAAVAAHPAAEKERWGGAERSFKIVVEAWGTTYTMAQQIELIESLEGCCGFTGPINLRAPDTRFWLIVARSKGQGLPLLPPRYYFGREVASNGRAAIRSYELTRRRYLGPTSMDTEMAFLMAALGRVHRGSLVLDPFVGTGSCLIPAAHRGALTLGADIDARVIKLGKKDKAGRPVNVWTNFADYGLPPPQGLLRCDLHTFPWRAGLEEVLDAIVCDPPYGVRAGGRKSVAKVVEIRNRATYFPSTHAYTLAECLRDLLGVAGRLLRVGGRLVFFIPAAPGYYFEAQLPRHPALETVANCEQMLTTRYSRRLVVMEKVRAYDAAAEAAYLAQQGPPRLALDDMHEYLFKKPAELAAEAGLTLEAHREVMMARIPRSRGKNI